MAIGGIITTLDDKIENKIPWFGDLPWVGAAFRYRTQDKVKQELVFILTPHVTRNRDQRTINLLEQTKRMDWMLPEVTKVYTPRNLGPILPPPGEGVPGSGTPGCGMPGYQPPLVPGVGPEALQAPRLGDGSAMPGGGGVKPHLVMPQWPEVPATPPQPPTAPVQGGGQTVPQQVQVMPQQVQVMPQQGPVMSQQVLMPQPAR